MVICYCVCHSFTNLVIIDYGYYRLRSCLGSDTMFFDNAKRTERFRELNGIRSIVARVRIHTR